MRKLASDGIRTNSRGEPQVPLVSARQEILTSLVSALDSVVRPVIHHLKRKSNLLSHVNADSRDIDDSCLTPAPVHGDG